MATSTNIAEAYEKAQADYWEAIQTEEREIREQADKAPFETPYPIADEAEKARYSPLRRGAYEGVYGSLFLLEGEEAREVRAEGHAQGGDAAGHDDHERGPAEEEAPERAVGLAKVVIEAAGAGEHGPELAVGEGACQGQQAASQPDPEDQPGMGQHPGHVGRGQEDARAHDRADREQRAVPGAQAADEPGAGLFDGHGFRERHAEGL